MAQAGAGKLSRGGQLLGAAKRQTLVCRWWQGKGLHPGRGGHPPGGQLLEPLALTRLAFVG